MIGGVIKMNWTDKDTQNLLTLKNQMDSDDIRIKEKIKEVLLNNKYILHVLDNHELEPLVDEDGTGADEYFGVNILPYYIINPVQHAASTYICYEISYNSNDRSDRTGMCYKELNIIFYILSNYKDIINTETGIAKHDLLAALITDQFNHTTYFGQKITLVADVPGFTDRDFAVRTLTFRQTTDNSLVKTVNGVTQFANKIEGAHFVG